MNYIYFMVHDSQPVRCVRYRTLYKYSFARHCPVSPVVHYWYGASKPCYFKLVNIL